MLSPVCCNLIAEVMENAPLLRKLHVNGIQDLQWFPPDFKWRNEELEYDFTKIKAIREHVNERIEYARREKLHFCIIIFDHKIRLIGNSLEAQVHAEMNKDVFGTVQKYGNPY